MSENSETCEIIAGLKSTPQELANMLIEAVEDIEPYQLGIMFHNFCKDNQADHMSNHAPHTFEEMLVDWFMSAV
tara:strand:- start:442 stop:663 length:222 start_codon:yes stop_codon:yes gene_type:complete